ncbi:hypothetical protein ALC57_15462 [Trachymyrmex cornetzi]|uniref:Uncharacterized protein n=1 Tax=Trachymyrmex cornetzi TaxID=471704 RepID=A0A151IWY8_9HYME|nr:hypothetical protein ALC57_15462 [Trachymyrmex cornetzi]
MFIQAAASTFLNFFHSSSGPCSGRYLTLQPSGARRPATFSSSYSVRSYFVKPHFFDTELKLGTSQSLNDCRLVTIRRTHTHNGLTNMYSSYSTLRLTKGTSHSSLKPAKQFELQKFQR